MDLHAGARTRRVTAMLLTREGVRLMAQGGAALTRKMAQLISAEFGAIAVKARVLRFALQGERIPHAELQLIVRAQFLGLQPFALVVEGA